MRITIKGSWMNLLLSIMLLSVSLAFTALQSSKGNLVMIFGGSLLIWLSYISAHKISTGKFVDGKTPSNTEIEKDEKMTPKDTAEYIGITSGAIICILGIALGSTGIKHGSFFTTTAGATMFVFGYMTAHLSTTGKLL